MITMINLFIYVMHVLLLRHILYVFNMFAHSKFMPIFTLV